MARREKAIKREDLEKIIEIIKRMRGIKEEIEKRGPTPR